MALSKRVDQVLRARGSKADQINDCIRFERRDSRAECPGGVLRSPINVDAVYCVPFRMRYIRLASSTARDDYVVARIYKSRDEERTDVTGSADDDNSHLGNVPWGATHREFTT